ncbi:MAG: hypothetical protein DMF84_20300 [Acidobacteria bacterium]|nr:MAG: hypothetical protein DMF84_20300 [Acidobacteriota bacterium]
MENDEGNGFHKRSNEGNRDERRWLRIPRLSSPSAGPRFARLEIVREPKNERRRRQMALVFRVAHDLSGAGHKLPEAGTGGRRL